MMGLVEEGQEVMAKGEAKDDATADLALIGAAQRVEYYEMSGYTTAKNLAQQLRHSAVVSLLAKSLAEEENADQLLNQVARTACRLQKCRLPSNALRMLNTLRPPCPLGHGVCVPFEQVQEEALIAGLHRHTRDRSMGGDMGFSGYIFDVEGTLVDSVQQNLLSLQDALAEFGILAAYDLLQLYSGLDGDQTLQLVAPSLASGERKKVLEIQAKIYDANYLESVKPFPGVRDVFEALMNRGGRIALATDCKGPALKRYLSVLNVSGLIDAMACGDDVEHGKPDPRLVGLALRKLAVPAGQAVMIGDTPYDAEAACGAGAAAAGLLTGGFGEEALAGAGCFVVAKDLRELLSRLEVTSPRPALAEAGVILTGCERTCLHEPEHKNATDRLSCIMSRAETIDKRKSLLADLLTCVACNQEMRIERGDPDDEGRVMVQYRCGSCGHIELVGMAPKS